MPSHASGCAVPHHVPLGKPQSDAWAVELERSPEVVACRGKWLAAAAVLPRPGTCRAPGLAGAHDAPGRVFPELPWWASPASSSRGGLLCFCLVVPPSSSCRGLVSLARQAPLAGVLPSYFVLEWPKQGHGRFWRSPGQP